MSRQFRQWTMLHTRYTVLCQRMLPQSLPQFFSVPGYVNVTYICEEGYRLQDPNKNMIGCKYVTTPRKLGWRDHETVAAKAVWTRTDGIMCEKGEKTVH